MKGLIVVLCLAIICSFTAGASLRNFGGKSVVTNQTLEALLNTQFGEFASQLRTRLPTVWAEITNAPVNSQQGDFTIFAPVNSAVKSNITRTEVLEYHIVRGDRQSTYIQQFTTIPTLYNATGLNNHSQVLSFTVGHNNATNASVIAINNQVTIVEADLIATNGIVHSISGVLSLPSSTLPQLLGDNYSTLTTLIKRANLTNILDNITDVTVLAPNDAAFNTLFTTHPAIQNYVLGTVYNGTIKFIYDLLTAHVVERSFYPSSLENGANSFTSLALSAVNVTKNATTGAVNIIDPRGEVEANVVQPNMLASNGVVHGIDAVLAYGIGLNLRQTLEALNATDFLSALNSTGLGSLLLEDEPLSLFVPTNDALKGKSVNASILQYHVANIQNVQFSNTYVPTLLNLTSLNNGSQRIYVSTSRTNGSNSTYSLVNNERVSQPFFTLKKTVVYLINTVLSQPAPVAEALTTGNFTDLLGLLSEKQINTTGLYDLNAPRTTVFAPTTEAFDALPLGYVGYLRLTNNLESPLVAQSVLNNHILPNTTLYNFLDDNHNYTTAHNETITVRRNAKGDVTILNGNITVNPVGVLTENGIAYPINGIILPRGLEFNALDVLRGLPADGSDEQYGNYTTTLRHLNDTGLFDLLRTNEGYVLFPPTNAAWDSATETFEDGANATEAQLERLRSILNLHISYGPDVVRIINNTVVYRAGNTTNTTLDFTSNGSDRPEVELRDLNNTVISTANVVVSTMSSYGQKIYGVDRVLGVGVAAGKSHGLTTLEWILIGVGGAVLGLIILLVVAGAAYYLLVRPGRDGYRQIN